MTSNRPRSVAWMRLLKRAGVLVVLLLVTTVAFAAHWAFEILDEVAPFAGLCPPGPLNIPPRPCTVVEYVERMSHGLGLFGALFEWGKWVALVVVLFAAGQALLAIVSRHFGATRNSLPPRQTDP